MMQNGLVKSQLLKNIISKELPDLKIILAPGLTIVLFVCETNWPLLEKKDFEKLSAEIRIMSSPYWLTE